MKWRYSSTDDELISGFLGHDYYREAKWNSLMEVIAKIDSMMPEIKIPRDLQALKDNTHPADKYIEVLSLPICTPMAEVREKVLEFIKWYNEQSGNDGKIEQ